MDSVDRGPAAGGAGLKGPFLSLGKGLQRLGRTLVKGLLSEWFFLSLVLRQLGTAGGCGLQCHQTRGGVTDRGQPLPWKGFCDPPGASLCFSQRRCYP